MTPTIYKSHSNLTVQEKEIALQVPLYLQEYVFAKFNKPIKNYNLLDLELLITKLIIKTLLEAGVSKSTNNDVITFLSENILKDLLEPKFNYLSVEEIELAFKKGVRQEYGVFMGINIQTLHIWIRAYLASKERRIAIIEFNAKNDEKIYGKEDKFSKPNPEGIKKVAEIFKQYADTSKPKYGSKKLKVEKSEKDIFIQNCFQEHYNIWLKTPAVMPTPVQIEGTIVNMQCGLRLINYNGKIIDEVAYVEARLKELEIN